MDKDVKLFLVVYLTPIIIIAGMVLMFIFPNTERLFLWGLVGSLIIPGVFFMAGKGEWALAGWNTMSEEEKQKYSAAEIKWFMQAAGLTLIATGLAFSPPILEYNAPLTIVLVFSVIAVFFVACYVHNRSKL